MSRVVAVFEKPDICLHCLLLNACDVFGNMRWYCRLAERYLSCAEVESYPEWCPLTELEEDCDNG